METTLDILTWVFLVAGALFALTGALGILRMPDFYSRLHPAGKSDTLAQTLIMIGLGILVFRYTYDPMVAVKLVLITVALYLTTPVATHAISRAAHLGGVEPWKEDRKDG